MYRVACKDKGLVKSVRDQLKNEHLDPQSSLFKALFKFHMLHEFEKKSGCLK